MAKEYKKSNNKKIDLTCIKGSMKERQFVSRKISLLLRSGKFLQFMCLVKYLGSLLSSDSKAQENQFYSLLERSSGSA